MLDLSQIKTYRINDQLVWSLGDGIEKLEALINRPLPTRLVKAEPAVAQVQVEAPKPTVSERFPTGKLETKLCAAKRIYSEMVGASKADIISRFISELQMTAAGAQTYYYSCKKG